MKIKKIAIGIAIVLLTGCSSEPNIEVSIQTNQHWGSLVFVIQSIADDVVVSNVVVNRGSCALPRGTTKDIEREIELSFGESYRGYSPS